jgi:hypothetical protein
MFLVRCMVQEHCDFWRYHNKASRAAMLFLSVSRSDNAKQMLHA